MIEVLGDQHEIVALDENDQCLSIAAQTLSQAGRDVPPVNHRIKTRLNNEVYVSHVEPAEPPPLEALVLIQSDICNDLTLLQILQRTQLFDAVTIWLNGVHMLRQHNSTVMSRDIKSDAEHRFFIQNNIYEWADQLLRPCGVLQVADRNLMPTSYNMDLLRSDVWRAHHQLAALTSLKVVDVTFDPYEEPSGTQAPMTVSFGKSGMAPVSDGLAIVSIISEKTQS
jgi:hypothetical protein